MEPEGGTIRAKSLSGKYGQVKPTVPSIELDGWMAGGTKGDDGVEDVPGSMQDEAHLNDATVVWELGQSGGTKDAVKKSLVGSGDSPAETAIAAGEDATAGVPTNLKKKKTVRFVEPEAPELDTTEIEKITEADDNGHRSSTLPHTGRWFARVGTKVWNSTSRGSGSFGSSSRSSHAVTPINGTGPDGQLLQSQKSLGK